MGRLEFPIFCYCLTVGLLYTHNIKRYFGRLALFAVISQPFYALNADPTAFYENLTNWNIFFTLILSLLFIWGISKRKWYGICTAVIVVAMLAIWNFDYGSICILLMLIFYFCRNKPALGAILYFILYIPALWGASDDPYSLMLGGHAIDWTIFALLAAPVIFCSTHTNIKISKWFFYVFYPAHLAVLVFIEFILMQ